MKRSHCIFLCIGNFRH